VRSSPLGTITGVKTVVLGTRPPELDEIIHRRQALGQDRLDEVWEGDYHMAPAPHQWHGYVVNRLIIALEPLLHRAGLVSTDAFNLGAPDDFRVPDIGLHRALVDSAFVPTAALVVEVVSPGDESWEKFDFFAAHAVDEVLIADPHRRELALFVLDDREYRRVEASRLLGIDAATLHTAVHWPD
jgi:Uma2 family endonuclease